MRLSTIAAHDSSDCHQQAIREKEHSDAKSIGKSSTRKIQQQVSPDSALVIPIQYMGKNDCDTLSKFRDISHHIPCKDHRLPCLS